MLMSTIRYELYGMADSLESVRLMALKLRPGGAMTQQRSNYNNALMTTCDEAIDHSDNDQ